MGDWGGFESNHGVAFLASAKYRPCWQVFTLGPVARGSPIPATGQVSYCEEHVSSREARSRNASEHQQIAGLKRNTANQFQSVVVAKGREPRDLFGRPPRVTQQIREDARQPQQSNDGSRDAAASRGSCDGHGYSAPT